MAPESSAKYDEYLSAARDFPGGPFPVSTRYLLCSSPRTGSTLLGQMLTDTASAGDPLEYFNPAYVQALMRRLGERAAEATLDFLERHRTTSNGVFGLQIHWSHFSALHEKQQAAAEALFARQDRLLFLRRKDRVAQALSWYRASSSRLWSSIDEDRQGRAYAADDRFDPARITDFLQMAVRQDMGWARYIESRKKPSMTVYYEDLVADWEGTSRRVLDYLGVHGASIPPMALRQQRPEEDELARAYKAYLGGG